MNVKEIYIFYCDKYKNKSVSYGIILEMNGQK